MRAVGRAGGLGRSDAGQSDGQMVGRGRDSKRHSTAQRTAAQGAELRTLDIACDSIACRATLNMAAHVHTHP